MAGSAAEFLYRGDVAGSEGDHEYALEQLRFLHPEVETR